MTATLTRARRSRPSRRQAVIAFLVLTGPMILGLLVFKYVAIAWAFLLSFSDGRRTIQLGQWVGFDNYAQLLGDDRFRESLVVIVAFTAFIVPVTFAASLALAVLVNRVRRGRALFRTSFLIPAAVSYVAATLVWKMALFNGLPTGIANAIGLTLFDADPVPWIQTEDPPLYWVVLISLRLWLQVGLYMILFLAGLQAIPRQLYEAAALDGAGSWARFRYVTLPQLRNTSVAILLLLLIAAMQAFDEFYNLFSSGLGGAGSAAVRPPLVYLYDVALKDQNYGVGSAGAFVITLLIIIVTLLQGRISGFGRKG
ncbi:carbohydrate ABC transporter permease [Nonomuraea endophytica]|uniref:carbohydrate ABC transporter permease n=1 Tax=Nonomuraea endophytica TaxID=714136 RepID=UPI0037C6E1EF